mmetsp:Transcript_12119/g.15478  ORF Transcript_12119/g.15478 Transcript_12119/m.15478 type:complete len:83 (-) Transcript_12119:216-464(-)
MLLHQDQVEFYISFELAELQIQLALHAPQRIESLCEHLLAILGALFDIELDFLDFFLRFDHFICDALQLLLLFWQSLLFPES